jgi:5-methylcytosine-specific restriction endonuclease McrA
MQDYIEAIVKKVEPEILSSLDEIRRACPSANDVCLRGYPHQVKLNSLNEIEMINKLYRECALLNEKGNPHEVDHKQPLFKGGLHTLTNLQILPKDQHKLKNIKDRTGSKLNRSTRQRG